MRVSRNVVRLLEAAADLEDRLLRENRHRDRELVRALRRFAEQTSGLGLAWPRRSPEDTAHRGAPERKE